METSNSPYFLLPKNCKRTFTLATHIVELSSTRCCRLGLMMMKVKVKMMMMMMIPEVYTGSHTRRAPPEQVREVAPEAPSRSGMTLPGGHDHDFTSFKKFSFYLKRANKTRFNTPTHGDLWDAHTDMDKSHSTCVIMPAFHFMSS